MIRLQSLLCAQMHQNYASKVLFQPVSLVINGNKYLSSLSSGNIDANDVAKRSLENMKIIIKKDTNSTNNKSSILNAKDWVHELHLNGTGYLTLSKKDEQLQHKSNTTTVAADSNKKNIELVLVTSSSNGSDRHQTFIYETLDTNMSKSFDEYPTILDTNTSLQNPQCTKTSPLRWRNFALGDIKLRIKEAVEAMRDFALKHNNQINLPESDKNTYLNALSEAEKFIEMDVMVTSKKDKERLFNYLQLPSEYTSSAQARVALQILNAAMSAWIFNYPMMKQNPSISQQNDKVNQEFLKLSKELYEAILDSVLISSIMSINKPVVFKHKKVTTERIEKYISDTYFTDANIYGKIYPLINKDAVSLKVTTEKTDRLSYNDAMKLSFRDCKVGEVFGPSWVTYWFKVHIEVPKEWKGKIVHFLWNSSSEAMIFKDGIPVQGLTGGTWVDKRIEYKLFDKVADGGELVNFEIEMACNGMFGVGKDGLINPCDETKTFKLERAEIAVFDEKAYKVYTYLTMLYDIAKNFPEDSVKASQAIWCANEMINHLNVQNSQTFDVVIEIAKKFFSLKNGDSQTVVTATGHCHIDVSWLWFYAETKRKAARSFATQVLYMDYYPEYKFTQSQAQLYQWTKELYPELYQKIKEKVVKGQWFPVGGTWVEMDGNLPSGESFIRQFLMGQRFFKKEFGEYSKVFFLPDTFGYSAQLPQVINHMGIRNFMTQKLSWNNINKFPHNTFIWEGIDGSQVLTHFPPANTYNSQADVKELVESATNNKDIERCNHSLMLYGNGDGGGGPTIPMLDRLHMLKDTDGIPKVKFSSVDEFFDTIEGCRENLLTWIGELYFELHRGTYTSQAATKKGNRYCERELHSLEMIMSLCDHYLGTSLYRDHRNSLQELWELVLLNQFHDVLPGSSIGLVYKDCYEHHQKVLQTTKKLIDKTLEVLVSHISPSSSTGSNTYVLLFNSNDFEITRTLEMPVQTKTLQKSYHGQSLQTVTIQPNSVKLVNLTTMEATKPQVPVTLKESELDLFIQNQYIKLTMDKTNGKIRSLVLVNGDRELIKHGEYANEFVLYEDIPLFWDAWDVEIYTQEKPIQKPKSTHVPKVLESGPLRVVLQCQFQTDENCVITQLITVNHYSSRIDFETTVHWKESRKILRVEFPTNIRSPNANYEIQFGHIERPTHFNSSWDVAKFEVCGHRWADLSEYGAGLSLLNDCKYGYSIHNGLMKLSLLRAPKAPDAECDMGTHNFTYSLYPHDGRLQDTGVIAQGYQVNSDFYQSSCFHSDNANLEHKQIPSDKAFITTDKNSVIVETVKLAEDNNDLIVRVYESYGGHAKFHFVSNQSIDHFTEIKECNGLEEPLSTHSTVEKLTLSNEFSLTPFQIKTFRFIR
ncbi:alpha-mannosidase [Tieghemostelium lacteum]|uniref:alpha-mannosidase n=1 Tax=Tieghemostelium lacteum TaxID=361077 RepID=A0A151Z4K0_TIELA|nr:alpha-mannosidase [Tieghemostelium lacteum]|eukprot:KYQ88724.1 alpha-mannosidase [Tieghemostelium lacteum]